MSIMLRRFGLLGIVFALGCGQAVREDRSITFATDGKHVAFQHGRSGIFIAETEGSEPKKIFQPDDDVIAVSAPLWSPTDKRLIFTTARLADEKAKPAQRLPTEPEPGGNLHSAQPTVYTCWLNTEPKAGQPLNVPLFTVPCGQSGYVAANLAVRWHPDGQHILYIEQHDPEQHRLMEFDLQTQRSRQVFPHTGSDLLFDWAPDKEHLACVVSDKSHSFDSAGIWIGKPGEKDWWRVPNGTELGQQALENLRVATPVWANDSSHFAFVIKTPRQDKLPEVHTLSLASLPTRTVEELARGDKPIRDLHWRPDGTRLGYLLGEDAGAIHLLDTATKQERVLDAEAFGQFIGWDNSGEQLAFVARQALPQDPAKSWAFLLLPDVRARQQLLVAADAQPERTRSVFSGMQVTFPHWSPKESKLSLWATFRPAYRSWLSHLLDLNATEQDPLRGLTLRAGDPALVVDPKTGVRSWKAINTREKIQLGHYHLLHREYVEAWKWYEQADEPPPVDRSPKQFVRRFVEGKDALCFQAYCLEKLGRHAEAEFKRQQFAGSFLPALQDAVKAPADGQPAPFGAADIKPTKEQLQHWRDLYIAEVFLSLDALEDGEQFFRAGLKTATSDADRLSKALVLTQFLLLRDKNAEYAEFATDTVLPLLLRSWKPQKQPLAANQEGNLILAYSDGLSLLPLFASDFLAGLAEKQVRSLLPRWQKQADSADDDIKRLGIDLFLRAAAHRLGQKDEEQAAARHIAGNPARAVILGDKDVPGFIAGIRRAPEIFEMFRQLKTTLP